MMACEYTRCPYHTWQHCPQNLVEEFDAPCSWLWHYVNRKQTLTPEAVPYWQAARAAHAAAVAEPTEANIGAYVAALRAALKFHAPTGDVMSDKIEHSFNVCQCMDENAQLKRLVAREPDSELGRMARVEIAKRHWHERYEIAS